MTAIVTVNRLREDRLWPSPPAAVGEFHHRMPAYTPTQLLDAPDLAKKLGLGRVLVKAETWRMGLPSFKILGASWATYQAICAHLGREPEPWRNINELRLKLAPTRPFTLATATDGNHGRAVAFMARLLGFEARIFVPAGMAPARIQAMEREGATVTPVNGDYDDAVERSAQEAGPGCLVVSDTSWPGYETIPTQVIEGYTTIFQEIDDAIDASGLAPPDIVAVPMGVGAFMAAAVTHHRSGDQDPVIAGIEPIGANCVQASAQAGELSTPHAARTSPTEVCTQRSRRTVRSRPSPSHARWCCSASSAVPVGGCSRAGPASRTSTTPPKRRCSPLSTPASTETAIRWCLPASSATARSKPCCKQSEVSDTID